MAFSNKLLKLKKTEIGSNLEPFLKTGVILAHFNFFGKRPLAIKMQEAQIYSL